MDHQHAVPDQWSGEQGHTDSGMSRGVLSLKRYFTGPVVLALCVVRAMVRILAQFGCAPLFASARSVRLLAIDKQRSSPGKSHQCVSSRRLPVEAGWLRRALRLVYRFIKGVTEMPWMTIETATVVSVSVIACSTTGPDRPWLRANIR